MKLWYLTDHRTFLQCLILSRRVLKKDEMRSVFSEDWDHQFQLKAATLPRLDEKISNYLNTKVLLILKTREKTRTLFSMLWQSAADWSYTEIKAFCRNIIINYYVNILYRSYGKQWRLSSSLRVSCNCPNRHQLVSFSLEPPATHEINGFLLLLNLFRQARFSSRFYNRKF